MFAYAVYKLGAFLASGSHCPPHARFRHAVGRLMCYPPEAQPDDPAPQSGGRVRGRAFARRAQAAPTDIFGNFAVVRARVPQAAASSQREQPRRDTSRRGAWRPSTTAELHARSGDAGHLHDGAPRELGDGAAATGLLAGPLSRSSSTRTRARTSTRFFDETARSTRGLDAGPGHRVPRGVSGRSSEDASSR